jgi:hypothetical protein
MGEPMFRGSVPLRMEQASMTDWIVLNRTDHRIEVTDSLGSGAPK